MTSLFKPPLPVLISSGGGSGSSNAIHNLSSSVVVNGNSSSGSNVQITTNNTVALTVDNDQNVFIGPPFNASSNRLVVSAPLGECFQLYNTTNSTTATFNVDNEGGLRIDTTGSKIDLDSNNLYIGSQSLYINNSRVLSSAAELNYLTTTVGVASPLKALVVDSQRDIVNIHNLSASTLTGTIQTGFQPYITSLYTVNINDLSLNGQSILSTGNEINYLHGITKGIGMASKAVVLSSSSSIEGINAIQANEFIGIIQTATQPNITSLGTLDKLLVSTRIGIGTNNPTNTLEITSDSPSIGIDNGANRSTLSIDSDGNMRFTSDKDIVISSHTDLLFSGNSSISGVDNIYCSAISGLIQTASQPNITTIGTLTTLNVLEDVVIGTFDTLSNSKRITIREPNGQCIKFQRSESLECSLTINTLGDLEINPTRNMKIVTGKSIVMAGELTGVTNLQAATLTGVIQTADQPNITSIGTLSSLNVLNDINTSTLIASTLTGLIQTASQPNITSIGTLSSLNVANALNAGTVIASALSGTLQTAAQPNITSIGTLSSLNVTNAINAESLSASTLTGTLQTAAQPNITSIGTLSSLNVSNTINAASLSASTLFGTLQTAAQPNITSIGTLSSLNVTNAINAESLTASTLTGTLQTASQPNITSIGTLSSLNVSNTINATSLSAATLTGTLLTAAQPNITSIGILSRLLTNGPIGIGVASPTAAIDINTNNLSIDPSINISDGTNIASIRITSTGINVDTNGDYLTMGTGVGLKFIGGSIVGALSLSATNITGTLQTASQPNITSIGTLQNLNTEYVGIGTPASSQYRINIRDTNGKIAMISDGDQALYLSMMNGNYTLNTSTSNIALGPNVNLLLNGGTVIGLNNLSSNTITGLIQTAAQPNITSVGTLSSLAVSGGIAATGASITGSLNVSGDITIGGSLILSTPLSFSNLNSSTGSFNANLPAISTSNGGTLTVTGGASFSQNVIIGTSVTIGGSSLTSSMIDSISSSTPGIVTPSVFLSTDANKNLTGFNCLTSTNLKGTIKTDYQPYITTLGNLTNLNVNGYLGVGTASPVKQLEINSTTGDCLRLSYNKSVSATSYVDINVGSTGAATIAPSGGSLTVNSSILTNQIILGSTSNNIMPLEVGFVPFTMTLPYAYNTNANAHGTLNPGANPVSYNYSIRATGRILCTQSVDVMSDRRTKKNIADLSDEYCKSFIENTNPVSFNWKYGDNNKAYGYIAQELLQAGFSELVNIVDDADMEEIIDDDGFINPAGSKFTVSYEHIIPILAKNQKRIMEENKKLKDTVNTLMEMVKDIANKNK